MTVYTGGCFCGKVRYQFSGNPVAIAHCHCRQCQRASGGAMVTQLIVKKDAFNIAKDQPSSFIFKDEGGSANKSFFCKTCGCPLFSDLRGLESYCAVRATSLDDPSWVKPTMHIWISEKQPWDFINDKMKKFPKDPTLDDSQQAISTENNR